MIRLSMALLLAFVASIGVVSAQTSPAAVVKGASGEAIARISVDDVVDPFVLYDPGNPPIIAYHYVLLTLTVENVGTHPWLFDPSDLLIRDQHGYLFGDTTLYRDEAVAPPDLGYQEIPPGETVTGAVGFQVANVSVVSEIILVADSGQLLELAVFGEREPVALGSAVDIYGNEGDVLGSVSVASFTDPFAAYSEGNGPERGFRFIVIELVVDNLSVRPMHIDPNRIYLQDADGFIHAPRTIYRLDGEAPELQYQDMEPESKTAGSVGYAVLDAFTITRVLYQPTGDRLLILADLGAGATTTSTMPRTDATPAAGRSATDCAAIAEWLVPVSADAAATFRLVGTVMIMDATDDPDVASVSRQIANAFIHSGEQLARGEAPEGYETLNRELADAYIAYGTALNDWVDAVESGDAAAIETTGQARYDAEPALIETTTAVGELAAECGIEND